jgi:nucleoside phosphorylase
MVQSETGTATPGGALLTVRQAIQDLKPQAIIMCGVAYGLRPDKQKLGDILIAKQLQYYEAQKFDLQNGQIPQGDRTTASVLLLDRFRSADIDWSEPQTHFGLVLSGEKLVNDPIFRDWLLRAEPDAIGGEMEGAGLYAAAHDTKVDWILVKAISHWADGQPVNNDAHTVAANNAAQFVLHTIQLGGWASLSPNPINLKPGPG